MTRRCDLTGKAAQFGNRVSHSNRKTRHKFLPNLKKKRFWSIELGKFITLKVCASTIRSIDKVGLEAYAKQNCIKLK